MQTQSVSCFDSLVTTGNAGFMDCAGPFSGNVNGNSTELQHLTNLFSSSWVWVGSSDNPGYGPFTSDPGTTSGVLNFDSPVKGIFAIALKGGPDYSFYVFNGGTAGISSLNFDTLGIYKGDGKPGPALSHASLYLDPPFLPPIPEPESYSMLLAGLGLLGLMSRRLKKKAA